MTTTQLDSIAAQQVLDNLPAETQQNPKPYAVLMSNLGVSGKDSDRKVYTLLSQLIDEGRIRLIHGRGYERIVPLTPYDTGARYQPVAWSTDRNDRSEEALDRWGKVDFEDDESNTACTVWVEPTDDGKVIVHVQVLGAEGALVEVRN